MRRLIACARNAEKPSAMPSRLDMRSATPPAASRRARPSSFATTRQSQSREDWVSCCEPLTATKVSRRRNSH